MYSSRLRNGYRIIDEYVKAQYCQSVAAELGLDLGHGDPLDNPRIRAKYLIKLQSENEIDFDQILELSYDILREIVCYSAIAARLRMESPSIFMVWAL